MTTLYKPVLIDSTEQAEALPIGTPVLEVLTDPGEDERVVGADFIDDGFDEDLTPGSNFHHVALVPIEAEEETRAFYDSKRGTTIRVPVDDRARERGRVETRHVTPWEEA